MGSPASADEPAHTHAHAHGAGDEAAQPAPAPASSAAGDAHAGHTHGAEQHASSAVPTHHDHDHEGDLQKATDQHGGLGGHHHEHGAGTHVAVSLGLVVASYEAKLFRGDYQGMSAGASISRGRFGLTASLPVYRLTENGKVVEGLGDLGLHAHATLLSRGRLGAGLMFMAGVPTGDSEHGLGMGHVMLMPEGWLTWTASSVALNASLGYGHALGGAAAHAHHGGAMWPLVDPMNASEVTYSGGATMRLARVLAAGVRAFGAAPVGTGETRLAGGLRAVWSAGRIETSFEIQKGILGDPFVLRGMLASSARF